MCDLHLWPFNSLEQCHYPRLRACTQTWQTTLADRLPAAKFARIWRGVHVRGGGGHGGGDGGEPGVGVAKSLNR